MLEAIAILLFIGWLYGVVALPSVALPSMGSLIHILLVLCVIVVVLRVPSFENPFRK